MAAEEIFKYYAKGTDACGKGVPTVPLPIRLWGLRCTLRQPNKVRPKKWILCIFEVRKKPWQSYYYFTCWLPQRKQAKLN